MKTTQLNKLKQIAPMIGQTPLLELSFLYQGQKRRIFAKVEAGNLTGSVKDRVAHYILKKAYETDTIQETDIIAEATSGNTGISFSALGSYLGHKVIIYMPDWMSRERIALMESFGAQVRLVSREEGGFLGSIQMTEDIAAKGGVFLPRQFSNEDNIQAHIATTGRELLLQLDALGLKADGAVAGVGTGGTIMGLKKALQSVNPNMKGFPLEPLNSPTLSTGYKTGKHRIYGISDEFIPEICRLNELDGVVSVDDGDAIRMARMLSERLGLSVGISSGANFLGCLIAQESMGADSVVVTVFADDSKKYLSTDYANPQEAKDGYLTNDIELLGLTAHSC